MRSNATFPGFWCSIFQLLFRAGTDRGQVNMPLRNGDSIPIVYNSISINARFSR